MKWWEYILCILCITFCHYAYIKSYSNILNLKIKDKNKKELIIILSITILTFYNTFYNYSFTRIFLSFIELFLIFKIIFKESTKDVFIKTLLLYFFGWLIETILGGLVFYIFYESVQQFDNNISIKVLFSLIMMIMVLISSKIVLIKKIINKINKYMNKAIVLTLTIILFIVVLVILTFYLIISNEVISYISILALIVIFTFLFVMIIIQIINTKNANEKQEALLSFMREYEIIIDKERMERHEIVNNLLALKSVKNKNTKEYEQILDDILKTYKSVNTCRGLYYLPSGLKGIFYYKIYDMKNKNIKVIVNISNKSIEKLERLSAKSITKLCKIIGILLDNAKEAAQISKDKMAVIDVYNKQNSIIIYIENSIKNENVNIQKIYTKGYSTKGNNRGYGLYIVDKEIKQNKKLELFQRIDNEKFVTVLKIID